MIQSPETIMAQQLGPGERLLWSGQPCTGFRLRVQDAFLIPFSILWCGFAIFWEVSVIKTGAPLFFTLWGIPFVCIGLFLVFGRFFVDARNRARTFYGITNERVIIISGVFSQQVKSLQLRTLADISFIPRKDGSGIIIFGTGPPFNHFFPAASWPGAQRYAPPFIEPPGEAKEVYDIIRNAQQALYAGK